MNTENLISKFFTGINYWGAESAINMWENFNPESIENDFKLLKNAVILVPRDDGGITLHTLRASYMLAKQANIDVNFAYVMDSNQHSFAFRPILSCRQE